MIKLLEVGVSQSLRRPPLARILSGQVAQDGALDLEGPDARLGGQHETHSSLCPPPPLAALGPWLTCHTDQRLPRKHDRITPTNRSMQAIGCVIDDMIPHTEWVVFTTAENESRQNVREEYLILIAPRMRDEADAAVLHTKPTHRLEILAVARYEDCVQTIQQR
jgi:hypothetical protein